MTRAEYEEREDNVIGRVTRRLMATRRRGAAVMAGGYVCSTIVKRKPTVERCGVIVTPDMRHEHGCPMEGDMCGSRRCNETGSCQA